MKPSLAGACALILLAAPLARAAEPPAASAAPPAPASAPSDPLHQRPPATSGGGRAGDPKSLRAFGRIGLGARAARLTPAPAPLGPAATRLRIGARPVNRVRPGVAEYPSR